MLRLDLADRRRVAMVSALTVIALPSLWLMSRDDQSGAPHVATAGVAVGPDEQAVPDPRQAPATLDAMGSPGAAYIGGTPREESAGVPTIATQRDPVDSYVAGTATYRTDLRDGACLVKSTSFGRRLTVTNLDNGRTVTCRASSSPLVDSDEVVLQTAAFQQIADLTDAPVPVEIAW